MDRYEQIIRDIQRKTEERLIQWKAVQAEIYSYVLLNSNRVLRSFEAEYPVGGKPYSLLFVERRIDHHDEFGGPMEARDLRVFVLDDRGRTVVSLYDGVVDRDDLLRLSGLVDENNDLTKTFFDAFDLSVKA
jgi:hypothetical protein